MLELRFTSRRSKRILPRGNARRPPRNGQPCRRPEQSPVSNTIFCLNFVSITFLRQEEASWLEFFTVDCRTTVPLLSRLTEAPTKRCRGKVALSVVDAESASSKLPAGGVDGGISTGERRGFGASAPSSTRALSLHLVRAGGLVDILSSKLV